VDLFWLQKQKLPTPPRLGGVRSRGSVEACAGAFDDGLQALEVVGQDLGELVGACLDEGSAPSEMMRSLSAADARIGCRAAFRRSMISGGVPGRGKQSVPTRRHVDAP